MVPPAGTIPVRGTQEQRPMRCWCLVLFVALFAAGRLCAAEPAAPRLFPFVLPWDDAAPGVTDLSGWLPRPAGKLGRVVAGPDGHLYAGGRRVRFFGVNTCFAAD